MGGGTIKRAARTDDNHAEIVDTFVSCGASVLQTFQLGQGAPDIIVGIYGVNCLVEIKDGSKIPSKQKLTRDEKEFMDRWKGWYEIVKSPTEAAKLVSRMANMRT